MAGDAEAGVATDIDDVYLLDPLLAESTFYDLQRVEVLRGPQSTLYGRGAIGGVVNLITATPDLTTGYADLYASYGNYNAVELRGDINAPLVNDELAVRIAGDWVRHDGYIDNEFNNTHIDSQDTYSIRGSLRWEPTDRTTVDLVAQFTRENDSHMRSTRQLCDTDPTGVLGCLPTGAGNEPVNALSTTAFIESRRRPWAILVSRSIRRSHRFLPRWDCSTSRSRRDCRPDSTSRATRSMSIRISTRPISRRTVS